MSSSQQWKALRQSSSEDVKNFKPSSAEEVFSATMEKYGKTPASVDELEEGLTVEMLNLSAQQLLKQHAKNVALVMSHFFKDFQRIANNQFTLEKLKEQIRVNEVNKHVEILVAALKLVDTYGDVQLNSFAQENALILLEDCMKRTVGYSSKDLLSEKRWKELTDGIKANASAGSKAWKRAKFYTKGDVFAVGASYLPVDLLKSVPYVGGIMGSPATVLKNIPFGLGQIFATLNHFKGTVSQLLEIMGRTLVQSPSVFISGVAEFEDRPEMLKKFVQPTFDLPSRVASLVPQSVASASRSVASGAASLVPESVVRVGGTISSAAADAVSGALQGIKYYVMPTNVESLIENPHKYMFEQGMSLLREQLPGIKDNVILSGAADVLNSGLQHCAQLRSKTLAELQNCVIRQMGQDATDKLISMTETGLLKLSSGSSELFKFGVDLLTYEGRTQSNFEYDIAADDAQQQFVVDVRKFQREIQKRYAEAITDLDILQTTAIITVVFLLVFVLAWWAWSSFSSYRRMKKKRALISRGKQSMKSPRNRRKSGSRKKQSRRKSVRRKLSMRSKRKSVCRTRKASRKASSRRKASRRR
jgi:hypothetical protein